MAESPPPARPSAASDRDRVGVVVIGRNEGERLACAVAAALEQAAIVVYVDSNSDDGSRDRAAALGAEVVHLTAGPYTPSRGRQEGFEHLTRLRPDLPYVQFIDGDCLLAPGWIATARAYLDAHPDVVAVFGRRREERTAESLYSRLMDVDWDQPPGEAPNFGGDALVRCAAVAAAGGWSATTINAEDIDLSFRIRAATGGRIVRLADEMTRHDVRMSRFAQYWRRAVRAGYGYAEVGWRFRHGPGRMLLKRMASSWLYAAVLPAVAVVGLWVWWPLAVVVGLVYLRTLGKLFARARRRGADRRTAAAYAALNLVCKAASAWGSLLYLRDRLSGGPTRDNLIVYRSRIARTAPAAAAAASPTPAGTDPRP
jgi:glycosyltransferase involved in cell wall biosynthesis